MFHLKNLACKGLKHLLVAKGLICIQAQIPLQYHDHLLYIG